MFFRLLFIPETFKEGGYVTHLGLLVTLRSLVLLLGLWQPHRAGRDHVTNSDHNTDDLSNTFFHLRSVGQIWCQEKARGKGHFPRRRRPRYIIHTLLPPHDVTSLGSSDLYNGGWRDDRYGSQRLWGEGLYTGLMVPNFLIPLCFVLFKGT